MVYPFPYVTTVFSASNYCGSYGNKGAVMIFYPDNLQVNMSYFCSHIPYAHVPMQALKFTSSREMWVEECPYHSPKTTVLVRPPQPQASPEPAAVEDREREGETVTHFIPTPPPLPPILSPVSEEEEEEEKGEVKTEGKKVRDSIVTEDTQYNVCPTQVESPQVQRRPMRSHTVNYGGVSSVGATDMRSVVGEAYNCRHPTLLSAPSVYRRKSLVNLKRGHTGEGGSLQFRVALRRDSIHELHPGWNSIKKLGRVVG